MRDRALDCFTSQLGLDSSGGGTGSQELGASASSQDTRVFKKPSHPSMSRLQQEQQKDEQKQQIEMIQRQMAQQKEMIELLKNRERRDTVAG